MKHCGCMIVCGLLGLLSIGGCPVNQAAQQKLKTQVLFQSDRDGTAQLYLMDLDGGNPTKLTDEPAGVSDAVVSPDGREMVFKSYSEGPGQDLVRLNIDGTGRTVLATGTVPSGAPLPVFTADGSRVVFKTGDQYDIASVGLDGTGLVNLSNNSPGTTVGSAVIRPGTSQVGFSSDVSGNYEIYEVDASGGTSVNLTQNAASDRGPQYSPDGSKILFVTDRDGRNELYVMNADGSNPVRLTNSPDSNMAAAFSPDGTKVAYTVPVPSADPSDPAADGNMDVVATDTAMLHVVHCDGSEDRELTQINDTVSASSWSPDSRTIAFAARVADESLDVFVINADGTGLTNLTNSPGDDLQPNWTPDGQTIVFESWRDGSAQICSVNAAGTDQKNLSNSTSTDWFRRLVEVQ